MCLLWNSIEGRIDGQTDQKELSDSLGFVIIAFGLMFSVAGWSLGSLSVQPRPQMLILENEIFFAVPGMIITGIGVWYTRQPEQSKAR